MIQSSRWLRRLAVAALIIAAPAATGPAAADDRHAGYYYPHPQSSEIYYARATVLPEANRARRLGFVTGIAAGQKQAPYPLQYVIFAKGEQAEKLIVVALRDGYMDTIFRARAFLAAMTSQARATPIFADMDADGDFTFFDMAVLLGFKQITISDGNTFAHQIELK